LVLSEFSKSEKEKAPIQFEWGLLGIGIWRWQLINSDDIKVVVTSSLGHGQDIITIIEW